MRPLAQSDGVGRMEDYGTLQLANCNQIELGCIYIYNIYIYTVYMFILHSVMGYSYMVIMYN